MKGRQCALDLLTLKGDDDCIRKPGHSEGDAEIWNAEQNHGDDDATVAISRSLHVLFVVNVACA